MIMDKEVKLVILKEGQQLGVTATCKKHGISRTLYYRWLKRYKSNGVDGLVDYREHFEPANKTSAAVTECVLNLIKQYPKYGPKAIQYLMEEMNYKISESAVFNIMKRHNMTQSYNRLTFAEKENRRETTPVVKDICYRSGECWYFWVTNYGSSKEWGQLYNYTIMDSISQIACSRLYPKVSQLNFEELLTAVALPVAQTLNLDIKKLCLLNGGEDKNDLKGFSSRKLQKILQDSGFDIVLEIRDTYRLDEHILSAKKAYTEQTSNFLLESMDSSTDLSALKMAFQKWIRNYNINVKLSYDIGSYSPIEYHHQVTQNKLILPLWAYMNRDY